MLKVVGNLHLNKGIFESTRRLTYQLRHTCAFHITMNHHILRRTVTLQIILRNYGHLFSFETQKLEKVQEQLCLFSIA